MTNTTKYFKNWLVQCLMNWSSESNIPKTEPTNQTRRKFARKTVFLVVGVVVVALFHFISFSSFHFFFQLAVMCVCRQVCASLLLCCSLRCVSSTVKIYRFLMRSVHVHFAWIICFLGCCYFVGYTFHFFFFFFFLLRSSLYICLSRSQTI